MGLLSHDNKPHNILHRGTTCTVYFICKSRTNKTGSISSDTRNSRRQKPKNKKVAKVNESKQCMEGGLKQEPVEYGVSMSSPQLTSLIILDDRDNMSFLVLFTL